jgi:hypothetical protein
VALNDALISHRFPYIPISLDIGQGFQEVEALLDRGFDGDIHSDYACRSGSFIVWTDPLDAG